MILRYRALVFVLMLSGCGGSDAPSSKPAASSAAASSAVPEASSASSEAPSSAASSRLSAASSSEGFSSSMSSAVSVGVSSAVSSASSSDAACHYTPMPGQDTIVTTEGAVHGVTVHGAYAFLGIPFAAPPVGERRWQAPEAAACRQTTLEAIAYRPACAQLSFDENDTGRFEGSEDCLYLNVFTPTQPTSDALPILFFIHGGGNVAGSTSEINNETRLYDGSYLASSGNAVVVTTAYRLGAAGWLAHPDLADANGSVGNYGLQDQIAALGWVQANVRALGGDGSRILLFGESGGAIDVCMLMVSAEAAGLYTRALMQSGGCVAGSVQSRTQEAEAWIEAVGCAGAPSVRECLMALDAEALVAQNEKPISGSGVVSGGFGPTIDGRWISDDPETLLQKGAFNPVPFIIGANADESAMSIPPGSVTPESLTLLIKAALPASHWDQALTLYPPGESAAEARASKIRLLSDAQFICPSRRYAAAASAYVPTYRYLFDHAPDTAAGHYYGAVHGLELFYIFQTYQDALSAETVSAGDVAVATLMQDLWIAFAQRGAPIADGAVIWPGYDASIDPLLMISDSAYSDSGYRREACDFWDEVAAER